MAVQLFHDPQKATEIIKQNVGYLTLPRGPKKAAELINASLENSISCNKRWFVLCERPPLSVRSCSAVYLRTSTPVCYVLAASSNEVLRTLIISQL